MDGKRFAIGVDGSVNPEAFLGDLFSCLPLSIRARSYSTFSRDPVLQSRFEVFIVEDEPPQLVLSSPAFLYHDVTKTGRGSGKLGALAEGLALESWAGTRQLQAEVEQLFESNHSQLRQALRYEECKMAVGKNNDPSSVTDLQLACARAGLPLSLQLSTKHLEEARRASLLSANSAKISEAYLASLKTYESAQDSDSCDVFSTWLSEAVAKFRAADRNADGFVLDFLTAAPERCRPSIAGTLLSTLGNGLPQAYTPETFSRLIEREPLLHNCLAFLREIENESTLVSVVMELSRIGKEDLAYEIFESVVTPSQQGRIKSETVLALVRDEKARKLPTVMKELIAESSLKIAEETLNEIRRDAGLGFATRFFRRGSRDLRGASERLHQFDVEFRTPVLEYLSSDKTDSKVLRHAIEELKAKVVDLNSELGR